MALVLPEVEAALQSVDDFSQHTWQQLWARPVSLLGNQPGVFLSFALTALACQYLKRRNLAIAFASSVRSLMIKLSADLCGAADRSCRACASASLCWGRASGFLQRMIMGSGGAEVLAYMVCLDSKHLGFSPNLCNKGGWMETREHQMPLLLIHGRSRGLAIVHLSVLVDRFCGLTGNWD